MGWISGSKPPPVAALPPTAPSLSPASALLLASLPHHGPAGTPGETACSSARWGVAKGRKGRLLPGCLHPPPPPATTPPHHHSKATRICLWLLPPCVVMPPGRSKGPSHSLMLPASSFPTRPTPSALQQGCTKKVSCWRGLHPQGLICLLPDFWLGLLATGYPEGPTMAWLVQPERWPAMAVGREAGSWEWQLMAALPGPWLANLQVGVPAPKEQEDGIDLACPAGSWVGGLVRQRVGGLCSCI